MRKPVCQYDFRDADLRGHGCTLASLTNAARWATDGEAWDNAESFASTLQKRSGISLATFRDRGTTLTEGKTAILAAPWPDGRVGPRVRLFRGGNVRSDLIPEVDAGNVAVVAVDYGVVQDARQGVGSFRGGHAVTVVQHTGDSVTIADPLRRELVTWKVDLLVRAMERFGKNPWLNGRGEFIIVQPSPTLLEVRTQQRDKARKELAAIKNRLEGYEVTLAAASAQVAGLKADNKAAYDRIAILEAGQTIDRTAARQSFKDEVMAIPA